MELLLFRQLCCRIWVEAQNCMDLIPGSGLLLSKLLLRLYSRFPWHSLRISGHRVSICRVISLSISPVLFPCGQSLQLQSAESRPEIMLPLRLLIGLISQLETSLTRWRSIPDSGLLKGGPDEVCRWAAWLRILTAWDHISWDTTAFPLGDMGYSCRSRQTLWFSRSWQEPLLFSAVLMHRHWCPDCRFGHCL